MDKSSKSDTQSTFEFIAEHTSDVIVRVNTMGVVTYVSPSIRNCGYCPQDVVGSNGLSLFHPDDQLTILGNTAALLRGEEINSPGREHRFRTADGGWIWVEGAPRIARDAEGAPVEIVTVFRDITDRRLAEQKSREQAQLFEAAFEHSPIGKCLIGLDGRFIRVNPALCRMTGYTAEQLIDSHMSDLAHPDELGTRRAEYDEMLAGEIGGYTSQRRSRRADGTFFWIEMAVALARNADGSPWHLVAEVQDMTARLAADAALRDSELRYRLIAENSTDIIVVSDLEGRFTYVSPGVRRVGHEPEHMVGRCAADITHPDDVDQVNRTFARQLRPRSPLAAIDRVRWRGRHGITGEWVWMESSPGLIRDPVTGTPTAFIDVVRDISVQMGQEAELAEAQIEAARATDALRESETRYRLIAENMTDVVVQTDTNDVLVYVSPSVRAYGYEPKDLVGAAVDSFAHPDDLAFAHIDGPALPPGRPNVSGATRTSRYRAADGSWVWLEGAPRDLYDAEGRKIGAMSVLRDVTESRAQAELFEAAFTHAPVAMTLIDLDGRFLRMNPVSSRLLGFSPDEDGVKSTLDLLHPDELTLDREPTARLLNGDVSSFDVERRLRRADGTFVWAHISMALVRNADGTPKHFVSHAQDLTARKAAEAALGESEARYRMIAENTSDIILMADNNGLTTFVSPSIRQLGLEPEDLMGGSLAAHVHMDDGVRMWRALQAQTPGTRRDRIRWRCRHRGSNGWVWMESMPTRLWDPATGTSLGYLDVVRDVSRQVEQEEALAKARADAEAASQVKSQFLANMSHEIRTPLTAVLGYADVLATMSDLDQRAQAYARRISGAGSALLAIVNDILDFSKLEAGMVEVRPQPTEVAGIVDDTLALFEGLAAEKGLVLSQAVASDLPEAVMLDGDRLRQILVNLAGNAVKFTETGEVSVSVGVTDDGQGLRFEVEDTGPGLDGAQCANLFQRFNQIDGSLTRRHGGTGLGLAICKGLAEAMGGTIGVASEPGRGSIFFLTLPLVVAELVRATPPEAETVSIAGCRVLVVDDNPTNRELARRILEMFEVEVTEADGGDEALAQLARQPFDMVLLDLRMPDLDGREVLSRLRGTEGPNRMTPALAFTADAEAGHEGSLAAFDGVVRKPIDTAMLVASIAQTIAGQVAQEADLLPAASA